MTSRHGSEYAQEEKVRMAAARFGTARVCLGTRSHSSNSLFPQVAIALLRLGMLYSCCAVYLLAILDSCITQAHGQNLLQGAERITDSLNDMKVMQVVDGSGAIAQNAESLRPFSTPKMFSFLRPSHVETPPASVQMQLAITVLLVRKIIRVPTGREHSRSGCACRRIVSAQSSWIGR